MSDEKKELTNEEADAILNDGNVQLFPDEHENEVLPDGEDEGDFYEPDGSGDDRV